MKEGAATVASPRSKAPVLRIRVPRGVAWWWLSLLPVGAMFLAAGWQMRTDWTYDETYFYGWAVPALTGYLISVRWRDRPPAEPAAEPPTLPWIVLGAAFLLSWIIREANPDWRLIGVALGGMAVAAGLLWLGDAGGRAWQRHFAGAVAFFAVGIPWPTVVERAIADVLMPANAFVALEALHWLGVPAIRSGNLITLREGTLGVEEACSGIRSLQATLMMALFLGELYRLRRRDRCALLGLGLGLALLTNALRTIFLSVVAARAGLSEASRWHDSAGLTALVLHGLVLFVAAPLLARRSRKRSEAPIRTSPALWPARGPALLGCALLLGLAATRLWYGRHAFAPPLEWSLVPPRAAPEFEEVLIPKRTRLILRYDSGWSGRWRTSQGHRFHSYFLRWQPASVPPESLAAHHPGNCLTLAGMTHIQDHDPPLTLEIAPGLRLSARCHEFLDRGRPLFVFHAVEESASGALDGEGAQGLDFRARLRAAWRGRRSEGLRLIEIGIWNAVEVDEARALATDFLKEHLQVGGQRP